jgi:ribosomal protein L11 methyltransferase
MPVHHRYELPATPDEVEPLSARLWAAGALGCWQRPGTLTAWFRDPDAPVPVGGRWSLEPDRDWQAEWKATIGPVRAGDVVVVPSWLADDHEPHEGELTLVLDPGRAFGSGHHATTTLCLELLDELDLAGTAVADVGCGSGILALAAAARGARVVAVDLDPDAVEVTVENAHHNGVEVDARVGSVEALPDPADVVVANLVTDVIAALARPLVAATRTTLIASGISVERRDRALTALQEAGLAIEVVRERDGWLAVRGSPTGRPGGRAGEVPGGGDGEVARGDGEVARGDGEVARGDGEVARGDGEVARGVGEVAGGGDGEVAHDGAPRRR